MANIMQDSCLCCRICRLPVGEVLRPRAAQLMDLACNTLYVDKEDNVALCLKLAIELHRNFRNILEPKAPVLMEFVKQVCQLLRLSNKLQYRIGNYRGS